MTTIRQLDPRDFKRGAFSAEASRAAADNASAPRLFREPGSVGAQMCRLPWRPDAATFNAAIPFFYIGRNRHGFWVAREAQGRVGGLFMRQRSALRFARTFSEPLGCATMLLNEPLELDVDNGGSRTATLLTSTLEIVARRLPTLAAFVGLVTMEWRKLVAEIARAIAGERRNRAALERELFHGHYLLSSKNDDDLPIQ